MSVDYSQIEMRVMAHLSGDEGLIEAFRSGEDLHSFVGSRVFGVGVDEARRSGFTETIRGRRRYLPDLTSDNRQRREMAERMALNAPIQGSAADLIKIAMLDVQRAIDEAGLSSRMLLQVHDELVFEVAPGERERLEALVREHMGAAAELAVPLDVSVGTGHSWHEAAH
jgi:DNA polymerase-1